MNIEQSVRLKRLVIDQLFGPASSMIDIVFKLGQRVTVLHGRNGAGKTITLGLIAALRNGNLAEFARYPFKSFRLTFTNNTTLVIERIVVGAEGKEVKKRKHLRFSLRFELVSLDGKTIHSETLDGETPPFPADERQYLLFRQSVPWLRRIEADRWYDERIGASISTEEVLLRYEHRFAAEHRPVSAPQFKSMEFRALIESLPLVKFIKADRLFVRELDGEMTDFRRQRGYGLMVERLSQDIRALVVQADRQYRQISTSLDSSLANRLFEQHKDVPNLSELKRRSRVLREQAERLKNLGLLQEHSGLLDEERLSDEQKGTFFIILKDREAKLAPFAQVVDKAERLLNSLNRKLAPKSVRLDVEKGYQVRTATGDTLALENLSSGEQHELVLLHELLFDVRPGSLILIDEPELSLHVTWQVDVLPDLLEIAKLSDLDFVLATHSPYITRDHDDLLVRLGEPV